MIRHARASGKFMALPVRDAAPLLVVRVKCERVSRGNRTRRLNEMRRARLLMEKALGV